MTRRDYVLLTEALAEALTIMNDEHMAEAVRRTARVLADRLGRDNKAFDRERFLRDCGITQ